MSRRAGQASYMVRVRDPKLRARCAQVRKARKARP